MSANPKQRGQVLILLAAFLFSGGATSIALLYVHGFAPGELKQAVDIVVTDKSRASAAQSEIDHWAKALKTQKKSLDKSQDEIVKLARRRDATRAEADRIVADMEGSIREMDHGFLDARFRFKGQLTPAEWDALWARLHD